MEFALPFYLVIKRQIVWSLESHNYLVLEKISRDRQEVASTYGIKPRLSFTTSVNFFSHINWGKEVVEEEVMMSSSRKHDQQKWGRQQKSIRQTDNLKKNALRNNTRLILSFIRQNLTLSSDSETASKTKSKVFLWWIILN